jgi:hypothetical protein
MIQTKLRATIKNRDHLPGTWETPINPDGEEAANYIQNMIEHMGQIIKIALENVEDEATRKQIRAHAHAAIKGVQNESEAGNLLGSARAKMV